MGTAALNVYMVATKKLITAVATCTDAAVESGRAYGIYQTNNVATCTDAVVERIASTS